MKTLPSTQKLVFGTAALGMAYGLPRSQKAEPVDEAAASELVNVALEAGIDTFDTAPAYGLAEERLGRHLGSAGQVWTKTGGKIDSSLAREVLQSLDRSLERLRRTRIDLLQWHNWTADLASTPEFQECWTRLRSDSRIAALGASTYGARDALAAVRSALFRVVQVEWNLLNQSVVDAIAVEARERGVKIAVRSVFLQGALTDEGRRLPGVPGLAGAVEGARRCARDAGLPLRSLALRGALDLPGVDHVIVGFDRASEILDALHISGGPLLDARVKQSVKSLSVPDTGIVDPRAWHAP